MIFKSTHICLLYLGILGKLFCHNYVNGELFFNITDGPSNNCDQVIVENAVLNTLGDGAQVICLDGYDLDGSRDVECINGAWYPIPRCIPRCSAPPNIENGILTLNENEDMEGNYRKGTLATYSCSEGYTLSPLESKFRVCEEGLWTGSVAKCLKTHHSLVTQCDRPSEIINGYFVPEKNDPQNPFGIGERLHYNCKEGYILEGSNVQLCLESGVWSPKIQPICWKPQIDHTQAIPCGESPYVPHSSTQVVHGRKTADWALPGTVLEIKCLPIFRNFERRLLEPCQPTRLTCSGGRWIGIPPVCVPSMDCPPPPLVAHATVSFISDYKATPAGFPIKSQVSYQCLPDYILEGNEILSCSEGGCWFPSEPPSCLRVGTNYYLEVNNNLNSFLVSMATGAGVLSLLLVICLLVIFRRKKQLARALAIPPPIQRQDMGDHAILLHQPDRLALIGFTDGIHGQRNILPTYDEATRDRGPSFHTSVRLQRPHWQHISSRRNRNSPNPDMVHIGRHGSFVSHTPSTRSAGDSMGSTDTMAVSENSTNITLDTASSHSGSQAPSCRAHCGSLASFDTGSVIITEDVPLLEESELEEVPVCDTISLVLENPSLSDNASHKLSTASAEIC